MKKQMDKISINKELRFELTKEILKQGYDSNITDAHILITPPVYSIFQSGNTSIKEIYKKANIYINGVNMESDYFEEEDLTKSQFIELIRAGVIKENK